jgi:hypothetical protein
VLTKDAVPESSSGLGTPPNADLLWLRSGAPAAAPTAGRGGTCPSRRWRQQYRLQEPPRVQGKDDRRKLGDWHRLDAAISTRMTRRRPRVCDCESRCHCVRYYAARRYSWSWWNGGKFRTGRVWARSSTA